MSNESQVESRIPGGYQITVNQEAYNEPDNHGGEHLQESNVRSVMSRTSIPQELIRYFHKEYKQRGKCIDLMKLHKSQKLRLKKYKEAVYYGQFCNGKRQGQGIMLYDSERVYEGFWEGDCKYGQGYERFPNDCVYEGMYVNGKPEGVGRYSWPNGEFYEGQWINGLKHGSGLWQGAKGDSYAGQWKFGKADGYGVHNWLNGDRYEGEFKDCLKHGQGIEKFANGDIYKGLYINGKPSGFGQYYWKNGSYFKGNFKNGLRDGHGIWKRGPGNTDKYEGEYSNDKKSGYGIFTWSTGNVYKGGYECDLRNGYGEMYWGDGSFYKGNWKSGVQDGQGQIYVAGEGYKKGMFQNNKLIVVEKQADRPQARFFSRSNTNEDPQKSIKASKSSFKQTNGPSRVSFRSRGKSIQTSSHANKMKQNKAINEQRYNKQYKSSNYGPGTIFNNQPLYPKPINKQSRYFTIDQNSKPKTAKKQRILHSSFYMHKIGMRNRANTSSNAMRDSDQTTLGQTLGPNRQDMINEMKVFAKTKLSKDIDLRGLREQWH